MAVSTVSTAMSVAVATSPQAVSASRPTRSMSAYTLPPSKLRGYLEALTELMAAGQLRVVIDRKYPLDEAAAAHRYMDSGRKRGNVVLVPDSVS